MATSSETAIFETISGHVLTAVNDVTGNIVSGVLTNLQPLFFALLVLVIIILGYKLILANPLHQQELMLLIFKIILVWLVIFFNDFYQGYIDNFFTTLKDFFVSLVPAKSIVSSDSANPFSNAYAKLDGITRSLSDAVEQIDEMGEVKSFVALMLQVAISALSWIVCAIAFMLLLSVDILLKFFLAIGPLFFLGLLFDATRTYFFQWIQAIGSLLIVTLVIIFMVYLFSAVLEEMLDKLITIETRPIAPTLYYPGGTMTIQKIEWPNAFGVVIWLIVSFLLLLASPVIASMLAGGIGAPVRSMASAVTSPVRAAGHKARQLTQSAAAGLASRARNSSPTKGNASNEGITSGPTGNNPLRTEPPQKTSNYNGKPEDIKSWTNLPIPTAASLANHGKRPQEAAKHTDKQPNGVQDAKGQGSDSRSPSALNDLDKGQQGQQGQSSADKGDTNVYPTVNVDDLKASNVSADNVHADHFSSSDKGSPAKLHERFNRSADNGSPSDHDSRLNTRHEERHASSANTTGHAQGQQGQATNQHVEVDDKGARSHRVEGSKTTATGNRTEVVDRGGRSQAAEKSPGNTNQNDAKDNSGEVVTNKDIRVDHKGIRSHRAEKMPNKGSLISEPAQSTPQSKKPVTQKDEETKKQQEIMQKKLNNKEKK